MELVIADSSAGVDTLMVDMAFFVGKSVVDMVVAAEMSINMARA